jgi:hypothetical protein
VIFTRGIGITFIEMMNKTFGNNYLPIFFLSKITVKSNTHLRILWIAMDFICQIRKMLRKRKYNAGNNVKILDHYN